MKTNKINVVLSLNKTTVAKYDNDGNDLIGKSGAACATGGSAGKITNTAAAQTIEFPHDHLMAYCNHIRIK